MIPSFFTVRPLEITASTNEDIKHAAIIGEAEGLVVTAKRQTAGRGRQGRLWSSPEGNLYASVLLRPQCRMEDVGLYSFVAAMAVHAAVQRALPSADVQVKWPNDVLVNDKKISGILIETSGGQSGYLEWMAMGIGINVTSFPDDLPYAATSLRSEGAHEDAEDVLSYVLTALDQWRLTLKHDGFWPLRRAWLAAAKGGGMRVRLPKEEVIGQFAGLDERGRLILRLADGLERAIDTGDVFFA